MTEACFILVLQDSGRRNYGGNNKFDIHCKSSEKPEFKSHSSTMHPTTEPFCGQHFYNYDLILVRKLKLKSKEKIFIYEESQISIQVQKITQNPNSCVSLLIPMDSASNLHNHISPLHIINHLLVFMGSSICALQQNSPPLFRFGIGTGRPMADCTNTYISLAEIEQNHKLLCFHCSHCHLPIID